MAGGVESNPQIQPGQSRSGILGISWHRKDYPSFLTKGLGVKCNSLSLPLQFSGLLKTLQARVLPESRELFGIRMSPAGEEPESGPNQGAVRKGDRM